MTIFLGKTAKQFRESTGLTQRAAADALDVSVVHLCNVENNKSAPSQTLIDKYRELWGIDLHVLAWCLHGDIEKLPKALRKPAAELSRAWRKQIAADTARTGKEVSRPCSTSDK